jgi:hypothetical protein
MKKISVSESFRGRNFGGLKLPGLKGHVRIKLHNPTTGKNEIIEGNNIVTDALNDIFAANYLGAVSYGSLLSIAEKWFGGCLLYHDAFPTVTIDGNVVPDPTDYFPQGDDVNTLIAHAGDIAPASAAIVNEDLKRGSPVDISKTANSIKFTWDWTTRQGNGVISALALTHKDVGNAGIGNNSSAFVALSPFESIGNLSSVPTSFASPNGLFAQYDDNHGLWFHIGQTSDYSYRNTLKTSGTTWITIILRKLPYFKVGLNETLSADTQFPIIAEVETSVTFYNQPSYYFDYENKKLWLFSNIKSGGRSHDGRYMSYSVLDLSDMNNVTEESHGTIENDAYETNPFAPSCMEQTANSYNPSVARNANILKIGNDVFIPLTSGASWAGATYVQDYFYINGYQKINLVTSDQETILFDGFTMAQLRPVMGNGGLIVGSGYVCNGTKGYRCVSQFSDQGWNANPNAISWATHAFNEPQRPSSYLVKIGGCSGSSSEARYIYANKFVHTTKFNLPTSVEKTATQAMSLEYTLTEV